MPLRSAIDYRRPTPIKQRIANKTFDQQKAIIDEENYEMKEKNRDLRAELENLERQIPADLKSYWKEGK